MKKSIFILALVSVIGLSSCTSEKKCENCTTDSTAVITDSTSTDSTSCCTDSLSVDSVK